MPQATQNHSGPGFSSTSPARSRIERSTAAGVSYSVAEKTVRVALRRCAVVLQSICTGCGISIVLVLATRGMELFDLLASVCLRKRALRLSPDGLVMGRCGKFYGGMMIFLQKLMGMMGNPSQKFFTMEMDDQVQNCFTGGSLLQN